MSFDVVMIPVSVRPGPDPQVVAFRDGDTWASARLDGGAPRWTVRSDDSRYGGGWFSLLKNYDAGPAVEFRRVRVRAAAASERCANVG